MTTCSASVLDETGYAPRVERRFYKWTNDPFMPVEFSVAAYRFGHSMIRGGYKLNTFVPFRPTFTPDPVSQNPLGHFGGFRILPRFWTIEWARFFEVDGTAIGMEGPQPSRLIDSKLANVLAALPPEIGGSRPSLIDRNLTRGARLLLPSGQDVAAYMGADILSDAELELPGGGPAPLWYYILKEAQVQAQGQHLGQVGGRIVAEVFLGLLEKDQSSYLRNQPGWTPFLPAASQGDFTMPDLISFTGHGLDKISGPGGGGPEDQADPAEVGPADPAVGLVVRLSQVLRADLHPAPKTDKATLDRASRRVVEISSARRDAPTAAQVDRSCWRAHQARTS